MTLAQPVPADAARTLAEAGGQPGAADWRALDQAGRDRAYNNGAAVAGSAAIAAGWAQRSARLRAAVPCAPDLRYAPAPRCCIDLFGDAAASAPLVVFFHGGYWQSRAKEDFGFVAEAALAAGLPVALVGYSLAPAATLDAIVQECRQALAFLHAGGAGGPAVRPLLLAGWSAGAHLAASVLDGAGVLGGLAISGVYDLEPIRHTYLNTALGLDAAAAQRLSPLAGPGGAAVPLDLAWGADELPALRWQSARYALQRQAAGLPGHGLAVPHTHHFDILDTLAAPGGVLARALLRLAGTR